MMSDLAINNLFALLTNKSVMGKVFEGNTLKKLLERHLMG